MVVYNQREINGREYDFCVMAENIGILVIEVKGWLSDKIIVKGVDNIEVEGYEKAQGSPKRNKLEHIDLLCLIKLVRNIM